MFFVAINAPASSIYPHAWNISSKLLAFLTTLLSVVQPYIQAWKGDTVALLLSACMRGSLEGNATVVGRFQD